MNTERLLLLNPNETFWSTSLGQTSTPHFTAILENAHAHLLAVAATYGRRCVELCQGYTQVPEKYLVLLQVQRIPFKLLFSLKDVM